MHFFKLSFAFILINVLFACKSESPESQTPLIERNDEVREYIDVIGDLVNEYCVLVQNTVDKATEIDEKEANGEETTFMDGLEMLGNMASSAMKIKQLSEEIEEMEAQQKDFEKSLTTADYKEFLDLYTETTSCFYELSKKAEGLDN